MRFVKVMSALCALGCALPASAQCWDDSQLSAARVRDFQSMLMATTLRCNAVGMDISSHYNAFVTARRGQLDLANSAIKHRFEKDGGQDAYDRFVTLLANTYGDGKTSPAACDEAAATADDAAVSPAAMFELADQRLTPPDAEAGRCPRSEQLVAKDAPVLALNTRNLPIQQVADAPIVPPPAEADPAVTLAVATKPTETALAGPSQAEVAAAISVLTRYQSMQTAAATQTP